MLGQRTALGGTELALYGQSHQLCQGCLPSVARAVPGRQDRGESASPHEGVLVPGNTGSYLVIQVGELHAQS